MMNLSKVVFIFIIIWNIEGPGTDAAEDPSFRYVTAYNKQGRVMRKDDLEKTSVNVLKPIIFLISGVNQSDKICNDCWYKDVMEQYLRKQTHNVFIVDWNLTITNNWINDNNKKTQSVGFVVADFIATLFNRTGESHLDIHLVGVLWGSQVANAAAKRVFELTGGKVNRITALDPTYYLINDENAALDKENVNFLDVVHARIRCDDEARTTHQDGHVNFYVVDDEKCDNISSDDDIMRLCGIFITEKLFAKSINSVNFKAVKCASVRDFRGGKCDKNEVIIFGENVDINEKGNYFLKIRPN